MHNIYRYSILLILSFLLFVRPHAEAADTDGATSVPPKLWQSPNPVCNIAAFLTVTQKGPRAVYAIKVYVKNTSSTTKAVVASSRNDKGFQFDLVDSGGTRHRLHDHDPNHGSESFIQEVINNSGSAHLESILPGQTISRTIDISQAELALIQAYKVQYSFTLIDPATSQSIRIESLTQKLLEVPSAE